LSDLPTKKRKRKRRKKPEGLRPSNVLKMGDTHPNCDMNDKELKAALTETWPIRPGQEGRAWSSLQDNLWKEAAPVGSFFTWTRLAMGGLALVVATFIFARLETSLPAALSADSQSPGIFATAFYSQPAKAQVVWLNGMDPATDGPTYMDPTTKVDVAPMASPAAKPDQL
jgi:hypothetical protein